MRLAYLGTSEFAAVVLRRLAAGALRPALVVAPPDRRQGRGRRLHPPPVAALAAELGLELHQTADVNEPRSLAALRSAGVDLGLVCSFGQLVKPPLLAELELLNVHPSLLPRWRGAAPIERAIMAGDAETGVAIMRLAEGLDSGPVALVERVSIDERDDFGSLQARLAELGAQLAARALEQRERGELRFTEQDPAAATYAEKIDPSERRLDPSRPASDLARTVRALNPHIGTHLDLAGGERLGVTRAEAGDAGSPGAPGEPEAAGDEQPSPRQGELVGVPDALLLGCAQGTLRVLRVRPAGKREMGAASYLRGHPAPRLAKHPAQ